jgi:hypothetical protein
MKSGAAIITEEELMSAIARKASFISIATQPYSHVSHSNVTGPRKPLLERRNPPHQFLALNNGRCT